MTSSVRFTPHGIEDILRRDIRTDRDVESVAPLNLCKLKFVATENIESELENPLIIDKHLKTEYRTTDLKNLSQRKKLRTTFSGRQIFELEKMFETKRYLNASERSNFSR